MANGEGLYIDRASIPIDFGQTAQKQRMGYPMLLSIVIDLEALAAGRKQDFYQEKRDILRITTT